MFGISTINIELTSRCNKSCHMCGRRKAEEEIDGYEQTLGDMDYRIFMKILDQIDPGTVVQLHWNGEPTLYSPLGDCAKALVKRGCYVCMDTNGLLLRKLWKELQAFHSITVSVIEGDDPANWQIQFDGIVAAMGRRQSDSPMIVIRSLGKTPLIFNQLASQFNIQIINRVFHAPEHSKRYAKKVTKPEVGVCLDLLHHLAIDRHGRIFPCVRMNPLGDNFLGHIGESSLADIINGKPRKDLIDLHWSGRRQENKFCGECEFYGVPRG